MKEKLKPVPKALRQCMNCELLECAVRKRKSGCPDDARRQRK